MIFVTPPRGVSWETRFSFSFSVWHLGRFDWAVEDGGGVSGSDERRLDGNVGIEEEGRSRFTETKDLGGLNFDACRFKVRGGTSVSSETNLDRVSG